MAMDLPLLREFDGVIKVDMWCQNKVAPVGPLYQISSHLIRILIHLVT